MSVTEANCPSCGAAVRFERNGSLVVVCPNCTTIVGRGDRDVEDLGKSAAIVRTDSPLQLGLDGSYGGKPFRIVGHSQMKHPLGGIWDEWYASFDDGRWGWLAEAQGKFYLTFHRKASSLPAYATLAPESRFRLGEDEYTVTEVAEATVAAAEGELPWRPNIGETFHYADLTAQEGKFATIDYSDDQPVVYLGREIELADLRIPKFAEAPKQKVKAARTGCPNCGGPLELRAPDKTERVTCPYCNSQLDVDQGNLKFLKSLKHIAKPQLPLGAKATFEGTEFQLIGFMQRSVTFEGQKYYWEEYLLYNVSKGFRWLVASDGHWNYVAPVASSEVTATDTAVYQGRPFRKFQHAIGRVEYVLGEFYWKVEIGESVEMTDFVAPPDVLSREVFKSGKSREVTWSIGTYIPYREIEKMFGVEVFHPINVGPNQPFPYKSIYGAWAVMMVITMVVGLFFLLTAPRKKVAELSIDPPAGDATTAVAFSPAVTLSGRHNVEIEARANVDNSWAYLEGDLFNQSTGAVTPFDVPVEYYHGYDDGHWSEGSKQSSRYLRAPDAGTYTFRFEAQWPREQKPTIFITIRQGVPRLTHLLIAVVLISLIPIFVAIKHANFEQRRWSESDFGGE